MHVGALIAAAHCAWRQAVVQQLVNVDAAVACAGLALGVRQRAGPPVGVGVWGWQCACVRPSACFNYRTGAHEEVKRSSRHEQPAI
eukprot:1063066-Pelagomonas_calceolata.AAC.5